MRWFGYRDCHAVSSRQWQLRTEHHLPGQHHRLVLAACSQQFRLHCSVSAYRVRVSLTGSASSSAACSDSGLSKAQASMLTRLGG